MAGNRFSRLARRNVLAGLAASTALALPGCAAVRDRSLVQAIRRLLQLSTQRAFAKLTAPNGFWDSQVARFGLPELFGARGALLQGVLTSPAFRERLQRRLNQLAEEGARRAAPVVAEAVKMIGVDNAKALVAGEATAATSYLRYQMGTRVINEMIPGLEQALRAVNDPLVRQAIAVLAGVDLGGVAKAIAIKAESAIWYQIGNEEGAIRANPTETRDPLLIEVFGRH
jgi:hypothetical protein